MIVGLSIRRGVPNRAAAVLRLLKPGGYLLTFGGTRTYHRMACAVEDAGFEIRDCIMWLYGSGFPKAKSCLKPAYEPILLARKPGRGVAALGIDECRVQIAPGDLDEMTGRSGASTPNQICGKGIGNPDGWEPQAAGRWPANVVHDGSDEVMEAFAAFGEKTSGSGKRRPREWQSVNAYGFSESVNGASDYERGGDSGTAARFFYCAKASKSDRGDGNNHPTVKPSSLMEWLVKLVARKGETVLDPFVGSGTTAVVCQRTGRKCIGIDQNEDYLKIAVGRVAANGS